MVEKEELIKKYNIDIQKLEREQLVLAKKLEINNKIDFSLADKFGGVSITFIKNKILCGIIVCNRDYEVIDKAYTLEKIRFPYISGFRAYRELPAIVETFNKLNEKPDLVFLPAQGISHPRLGLASHFSIVTGVPSIGISDSCFDCKINGKDILKDGKKVGKIFVSKEKSRPMYISPGNKISIETSLEFSEKLINFPHKKPEPLHLAGKYLKEVKKELI